MCWQQLMIVSITGSYLQPFKLLVMQNWFRDNDKSGNLPSTVDSGIDLNQAEEMHIYASVISLVPCNHLLCCHHMSIHSGYGLGMLSDSATQRSYRGSALYRVILRSLTAHCLYQRSATFLCECVRSLTSEHTVSVKLTSRDNCSSHPHDGC